MKAFSHINIYRITVKKPRGYDIVTIGAETIQKAISVMLNHFGYDEKIILSIQNLSNAELSAVISTPKEREKAHATYTL